MNFGTISSIWFGLAAGFLVLTGSGEWSTQSKGASSWENETSFASLQLRAQGKLKIGLGMGFLALAMSGRSWESYSDVQSPPSSLTGMDTPEPPKPEPQQVKPLTGIKRASTMPVKPPTFKKD